MTRSIRFLDEPPFSLVAHTTVEFGEKHVEDDKTIIGEQIRDKIFEFLPELPREFDSIKFHKWKYSQVKFIYFFIVFSSFDRYLGRSIVSRSIRLCRSSRSTGVDSLGRWFCS